VDVHVVAHFVHCLLQLRLEQGQKAFYLRFHTCQVDVRMVRMKARGGPFCSLPLAAVTGTGAKGF